MRTCFAIWLIEREILHLKCAKWLEKRGLSNRGEMTWGRNDRKGCRYHTRKWVAELVVGSLLSFERFFSEYPLLRYHQFHF